MDQEQVSIETFEPSQITHIERGPDGQLVVHVAGREPVKDVRVARCFPWSRPEQFISIRSAAGQELCLLKGLDDLAPAGRTLVQEELDQKVFNPKISRVLSSKSEFGIVTITAQTDRGVVSFQVRTRDDIRMLSTTRALFRDVDGNIYDLPDINLLDAVSRRHFHQYF